MALTRRSFMQALGGSIAAVAGLSSVACNDRTRRLKVANWADLIDPALLRRFEEEFDCVIAYDNYSSNEELHSLISSRPSAYDVVFPSDYMVSLMVREGLLLDLDHDKLGGFTNLDESVLDLTYDPDNQFSVPYVYWGTGFGINDDFFSGDGEVGSSWEDLYRPQASGRVTVLDEMRYTLGMALLKNGYGINDSSEVALAAAVDELLRLRPHLLAFATDIIDLLTASEAVLSYGYSGDIYQAMQANKSLRFSTPSSGGIVGVDNMCITKGAAEPLLAHSFIDFMLRPEHAAMVTEATAYATANAAAVRDGLIPIEVLENPAIYLPIKHYSELNVLRDVGEANDRFVNAWKLVKRGVAAE